MPWFEVLADNYLCGGGPALAQLDEIRSRYPMVFHCVGMNLGSVDPIDLKYLKKLKRNITRFDPAWVSDHLCWSAVSGRSHHDLLPLPYTEEVVRHVSERILSVQEFLGRQILIENVSSYIQYRDPEMTEWEFLSEVSKRSDCLILLDINNVYVNSVNHDFSPDKYLKGIPRDRVRQFHIAGYEEDEFVLVDTHGSEVSDSVWKLYKEAIRYFGPIPTAIERDNNIPDLQTLLAEKGEAERWIDL